MNQNQQNSQYKDRGMDLLGKIFECQKPEVFEANEFVVTLLTSIVRDLVPDLNPENNKVPIALLSHKDSIKAFFFACEELSLHLTIFMQQRSIFVDIFGRGSMPRFKIIQAFNKLIDNFAAQKKTFVIMYRP